MKSKKKVSGVYYGMVFVKEGHGFFNLIKGGHLQKSLGNPVLDDS